MNYPTIVRTRGYKLYSNRGAVYTDLWLVGGRALLGHTLPKYLGAIKSTLARGLFAPYPSIYQGRVEKLLKKSFPNFPYITYVQGEWELLHLVESTLGGGISDLGRESDTLERAVLWRPFTNNTLCNNKGEIEGIDPKIEFLVPVLPVVSDIFPRVILSKTPLSSGSYESTTPWVSPFLLDGLVKGIATLQRALPEGYRSNGAVEKAVDVLGWYRNGPYLYAPLSVERYQDFVNRALEAQLLVPPTQRDPIIIPRVLSSGEEKHLVEFFRSLSDL